jgi:hypothetical protein
VSIPTFHLGQLIPVRAPAARERPRDESIGCPRRRRREQLNGADTAPCGRGCAPLAPFVGQNDDPKTKGQTPGNTSLKTTTKIRKRAVIIFPKAGVQLISRPLTLHIERNRLCLFLKIRSMNSHFHQSKQNM